MAENTNEMTPSASGATPTADAAARPTPTVEEIRLQIEDTRAEMSETIDAIQTRISPSSLASQAKDTFLQRLRQNPGPVTLIGAGAAGVLSYLVNRPRRRTDKLHLHARTTSVVTNTAVLAAACAVGWAIWNSKRELPPTERIDN